MRIIPPFLPRRWSGFTLVELLTVMAIIAILAGLILSLASYANKKAATSRAFSEIHALGSACESYKSDNGTYPHQALAVSGSIPSTGTIPSDLIDPRVNGYTSSNASLYQNSSLELYQALTGDLTNSGSPPVSSGTSRNYLTDMRPDLLGRSLPSQPASTSNQVLYLSDPFGNSYGYSTINATTSGTTSNTASLPGYNPTFDLWSVAGTTTNPSVPAGGQVPAGDISNQWIKNW